MRKGHELRKRAQNIFVQVNVKLFRWICNEKDIVFSIHVPLLATSGLRRRPAPS